MLISCKRSLIAAALLASIVPAFSSDGSLVPPVSGNTLTALPFLLRQVNLHSMRYQQVYAASAFSNVNPTNIYVTSIGFEPDQAAQAVICTSTNLLVHLSTTSKAPDTLSTNFAENIGPDEMLVFASSNTTFIIPIISFGPVLVLPIPFAYNPAKGNLLMDIRIQSPGPPEMLFEALDANNDSTDSVSRVYAESIDATQATVADTVGLVTVFRFDAVPSLQIQVESVFGTNRPVLRWPAEPSVFVPQTSPQIGTNAVWHTITNNIGGSTDGPDRWIYLPETPPGLSGFYRLIWPSGQQLLQSAPGRAAPAEAPDSVHHK